MIYIIIEGGDIDQWEYIELRAVNLLQIRIFFN